MQTKTPINTAPIERLLTQIKNADSSSKNRLLWILQMPKEVAYTLGNGVG